MKKHYTKKQIVEAIKHWTSILEKIDENSNVDGIIVEIIDDITKIKEFLPTIVDLVIQTYKPIGGYYGTTDIDRLSRTTSLVKIVKDINNNVASCAFYRNVHNSFKLQAYGHNDTKFGKEGIKEIIKSDVAPYTNWIWGEVSGKVEKYFKMFEGYPLPNELVAIVLKKNPEEIELSNDGFHYKRKIGSNNEATEKVIYGFPNQEIADKAMASADYEIERHKLNMQMINENKSSQLSFDGACSFIDQLSDLYDEEDWRQLTPGLSAMLDASIDIIEKSENRENWVKMTLDNAKYLKEHMPKITFVKNDL